MRIFVIALSLISCMRMIAADAGCQNILKEAQDALAMEKSELEVGKGQAVDVYLAEYFLAEIEYCAGQVSKGDYCAKQAINVGNLVGGTKAKWEEGTSPFQSYVSALEKKRQHKNTCIGK